MSRKPSDGNADGAHRVTTEKNGPGQGLKDSLTSFVEAREHARNTSFAEAREHARNYSGHQLELKIEGKTHATVDWTCGGFALYGFHRELTRGESIEGKITGGIARVKDRHFEARVVHVQENGYIGLLFAEISTEAFRALRVIELAVEQKTTSG